MEKNHSSDVTRITLAVFFIGILIASSFWIMRPYLSSLVWAAMIVVATWPVMLSIQAKLWGKRGLAVLVMTVLLLSVLVVPFSYAIATIIDRAGDMVEWAKSLAAAGIPQPPEWVGKIPLLGTRGAKRWQELAATSPQELSEIATPYLSKAVKWFVAQAGNVGMLVLNFLLTVVISAILYAKGEAAAAGVRSFARRLAGTQGEEAAILAGRAVRGVALGVVVTAFIQAVLGGIGLLVTGVPAALLLSAVMLLLCVAQIGPGLVLVPAIIWLFWNGHTVWGAVLIPWFVFVGTIDNVIRPILIKKGADLPLILIFAGVIGGLIAFGVIGLFIGPVILAVTFTLLSAWIGGNGVAGSPAQSDPAGKDDESEATREHH
jgi:predicted PurR-regulated permease PerM